MKIEVTHTTFGDIVANSGQTVTLDQYRAETFGEVVCTDLESHLFGECGHYPEN